MAGGRSRSYGVHRRRLNVISETYIVRDTQLGHLVATCGCWPHESQSLREIAASVQSMSSRACVCDRPAGYTFEVLERRNHGPRAWHGHRHRQRPGLARTDMSQTPAGGLPVRRTSVSAPSSFTVRFNAANSRETYCAHTGKTASPSVLALVGHHGTLSTLEGDRVADGQRGLFC